MKTKYFLIGFVILLVAVVSIVLYEGVGNRPSHPEDWRIYHTPPLLDANISSWGDNFAQGSTIQVNVTLTSRTDQELTVPIENLTLTGLIIQHGTIPYLKTNYLSTLSALTN